VEDGVGVGGNCQTTISISRKEPGVMLNILGDRRMMLCVLRITEGEESARKLA